MRKFQLAVVVVVVVNINVAIAAAVTIAIAVVIAAAAGGFAVVRRWGEKKQTLPNIPPLLIILKTTKLYQTWYTSSHVDRHTVTSLHIRISKLVLEYYETMLFVWL